MTFESYSREFTEKALSVGYSSENINKCLLYAKRLLDNNLPVIYNLSHFSGLVGYKSKYITRAVYFTKYFYRNFEIRKSNGGKRLISEPLPSLKEIQLWILNNILYHIPVSRFAKAYIKDLNLKHNLHFHKGQSIVLSLDIENFFSSINRTSVENIFHTNGYSTLLSNLFAKLCCLGNVLPQGAPTSPYLSNIYLYELDNSLAEYSIARKIRFTRYADDITFSGDHLNVGEIKTLVKNLLKTLGLVLNEDKTKIMKKGQRQIVTGVVVNEKLQVLRDKRKKIRQEVYYIKKFGLADHLRKINNTKNNYLAHVLGQVNFILFINPDDKEFQSYKLFLNQLETK